MSDATISSILSQIRGMQAQTALQPSALTESTPPSGGFGDSLKRALAKVDGDQKQAADLAASFERGDPTATLSRVMLAQQTAQIGFRATVEMRNRLVQVYQDVMNMPL